MGSTHRTSREELTIKHLAAAVEANGQQIAELQDTTKRIERTVADLAEQFRVFAEERRAAVPVVAAEPSLEIHQVLNEVTTMLERVEDVLASQEEQRDRSDLYITTATSAYKALKISVEELTTSILRLDQHLQERDLQRRAA